MTEKELRLAAYCKKHGVQCVWLKRRTNIAWITDGADVHVDASSTTGIASLLWTPRKKTVFTTNIESRRLADEEFGSDWDIQEHEWWRPSKAPPGRFATDFPNDPFAELRASLTDLELRRIRDLGRTTADVLEKAARAVRQGDTEHEIAGEMTGRYRKLGIMSDTRTAPRSELPLSA